MSSHSQLNTILFLCFVPVILLGFWLRTNNLQHFPPAISNDEAINAVDALHIARTGNFPMYEEDEGRAEPLFRIVEAIGILGFGRTVWALRIVSVLLSMPVIALVIWITRECLYDYPRYIRLLAGLFAGITLATLVGHVTLSRTLFRGVLQLLTMGLSIGFVLRGVRRNKWSDYILSGIFGGLTLYTYTAAWFFPPAFIILFLALTVFNFSKWRQWLPKIIILGLIALLISAPIIYLLLTYPRAVLGRAEALSPSGMNWARSIQAMIDQFLVAGDENPQYNVVLAPIIPQMMIWFFYLGLGTMLIRIRHVHSWFIISLLLLLTLPALLSNEITHGLRISGEYLIVPIIMGLGFGVAFWLLDKVTNHKFIVSSVALVSAVTLGGLTGQLSWERYTDFYTNPAKWRLWRVHEWELNHNEWFFRVDRQDFGNWISQQSTPILIPIEELNRQTTRSWLMNDYPFVTSSDASITFPDNTQLVMPWSLELGDIMRDSRQFALLDDGIITLFPPLTETSHDALLTNIDSAEQIMREGQIEFLGYVSEFDTTLIDFAEQNPVEASFSNGDILLTSWTSDETLDTEEIEILLTWESARLIGHEYIASVQLQKQDYTRISSHDNYLLRWIYPTTIWEENLPVTTLHQLALADDLEAGAYQVTVGLFYASYPLISAESDTQTTVENRVTVGWLKVPQPEPIIPNSAYVVENLTIDELFQLTHIEFADGGNGQLLGQLHWQSIAHRPDIDATIFVHIVDSDNQIIAQSDTRPLGGQYPTFIWDADETVRTDHIFNISDFENLDDYTVRVGMYIFPGPQNLPASYQDQAYSDGLVTLGTLADYFSD